MKRSLIIKFKDGSERELILSKAAKIKSGQISLMHLDQCKDGTWGLIWSSGLIDDFTQVVSFEVRRED